jgi:type VI secretion system secreted protein VgrG
MSLFEDRLIVARTPIPDSDEETALRFAQMQGTERISQCFEYTLELVSGDVEVPSTKLLGETVTVEVRGARGDDRPPRYFNGIVDSFAFTGLRDRFAVYQLVLVPNFLFLDKTRDNRIFQNMSVTDIVEQIFREYGFSNYELRLRGTYAPREYCVQYGETDLNFVQRLLEGVGIFYFFEHADGAHVMILCDDVNTLEPVPEWDVLSYTQDTDLSPFATNQITDVRRTDSAVTSHFAHTAYDFTKPSADLMATFGSDRPHATGSFEAYEYPGGYTELGDGDTLAEIRNAEDKAFAYRARAVTNARGPNAGSVVTVEAFPREAENDTYFVHAVDYDMADSEYVTSSGRDVGQGFRASYDLIPVSTPFRPERRAPWPVMKGPQTAQVVGPAGEEIHTDEYSRVKVQFHWDREGARDENSSCWVRVSSAWAGSGWGFIQIPRIGQEVIVDFFEGDPDQPIITGRVYNAEQMPPYPLPGDKTKSGWKSNSSLGGGGWNELMFEDKKGEELVYFQAEKDHDELVKNNETRHIGNDWTEDVVRNAKQWVGGWRDETVDKDKTTHVLQNRTVNIDLNDTEMVGVDRSLTVGSNETITVGLNSSETIGVNHSQSVGANQTVTVAASRNDTVGAHEVRTVAQTHTMSVGAARTVTVGAAQTRTVASDDSLNVGSDQSTTIGSNHAVAVGGDESFSVGGDGSYAIGGSVVWSAGEDGTFTAEKNVLVNAGDKIVLKTGKASITMKKDGTITIKGKDIAIDGSGEINVKASKDITMKGSKIKQN